MRFKYHMMGGGIGTLRVHQISRKASIPRVVWYRIGDQSGDDWKEAHFNLFGRLYKVCLSLLQKLCNFGEFGAMAAIASRPL